MEIQNLYTGRQHISSGSIFKLNNLFKKQWEVVFKEKRVKSIQSYDSLSFIAVGERVDQQKIWVSRIAIANGKIIWFKEFSVRHHPSIAGVSISSKKDIILLTESQRLIPLNIKKQYGKTRFVFFKTLNDSEQFLSLSSISGDGNLNWRKRIDFKKGYEIWGENIAANNNIMLYSSYTGFDKINGKYIKNEGEKAYLFNLSGHKLFEKKFDYNDSFKVYNFFDENKWLHITSKSDTLVIEKYDDKLNMIFSKTITNKGKFSDIQSMYKTNDGFFIYGLTNIKTGGCLICKLDTGFNFINSWAYDRIERNQDTKLTVPFHGDLMVLGSCYHTFTEKEKLHPNDILYEYINLLELKLK